MSAVDLRQNYHKIGPRELSSSSQTHKTLFASHVQTNFNSKHVPVQLRSNYAQNVLYLPFYHHSIILLMMSSHPLYNSLLRPPILHILRAAGFHATRPAVLDTLVDLTSRYLILLAQKTADHSILNHNEITPTIMDVRLALQDVGAFHPQISIMEEQCRGEEDTRGLEMFLKWMQGDGNREIRRIAGLAPSEGEVVALEAGEEREDFLSGIHSSLATYGTLTDRLQR